MVHKNNILSYIMLWFSLHSLFKYDVSEGGEGGFLKYWFLLTGGGVQKGPKYTDVILEQPLRCFLFSFSCFKTFFFYRFCWNVHLQYQQKIKTETTKINHKHTKPRKITKIKTQKNLSKETRTHKKKWNYKIMKSDQSNNNFGIWEHLYWSLRH